MPLLNGFKPETRDFLQLLGAITGVANLASLAFIALSILSVAAMAVRDREMERDMPALRWIREHKVLVMVLCLLALWIVWALGRMITGNMELAGVVGIGAILKLLFF